MKKSMLALLATVAIGVVSPAFAMEDIHPEEKKFAVFATQQLKEDPTSNCYVVKCEEIDSYIPIQGKYTVEIKNPIEINDHLIFTVKWETHQQGTRDFSLASCMPHPWFQVQTCPNIEKYYVHNCHQAVAVVNTNQEPQHKDGNVYYTASIFKALDPTTSNNFGIGVEQEIANIKWRSDFNTDAEYADYRKAVNAAEYQGQLAYDVFVAERALILDAWKLEAKHKISVH